MAQNPTQQYFVNSPSFIVDDSDPSIRYNGTWYAANESVIQAKDFVERTPLFNTLHVLQALNGSFSYKFTGLGVSFFATPFDNVTYTASCFLDEMPLSFDPGSESPTFGQSWPVSAASGLSNNTVLSTPAFELGGSSNNKFLPILDMEPTQPGNTPISNDSELLLDGGDTKTPIATFSHGRGYDPENGFYAPTAGSQFNLTFTGTRLWWYGYTEPSSLGLGVTNATFCIDGGATSNFSVPGATTSSPSQAFLFRTSVLHEATHHLTVVSQGNNGSIPLTLQSLVVQSSAEGVTVPPSHTPVPAPRNPLKISRRANLGVIAGGVGRGLIILVLLLTALRPILRMLRNAQAIAERRKQRAMETTVPLTALTEETTPMVVIRQARISQQNRISDPIMYQRLEDPLSTKRTERNVDPDTPKYISNSSDLTTYEQGRSVSPFNVPIQSPSCRGWFAASSTKPEFK